MEDGMSLWDRFNQSYCGCPSIELSLDISRIDFDSGFMAEMEPRMQQAFKEMDALEAGAVANPDEDRMVGHYWLRAPELSPTPEIGTEVRETINVIEERNRAAIAARRNAIFEDRILKENTV